MALKKSRRRFLNSSTRPKRRKRSPKISIAPTPTDSRDKYADKFPAVKLFDISSVAKNWDDANKRFFDDGGVFDKIYEK